MNTLLFIVIFLNIIIIENAPLNKHDSMIYLNKFGYTKNKTIDEMTENEMSEAIVEYQKANSLEETGQLDTETYAQMAKPRCAIPDRIEIKTNNNIWDKNYVSYKLKTKPQKQLNTEDAINEISKAFHFWANEIPLRFKLKHEGPVDIDITFLEPSKGDGPGNTLAYAYQPTNGDIYFDAEDWTIDSKEGMNFLRTAAHEIGHALGLNHSNIPNALMFPYLQPYNPEFQLHDDDITKIQEMYGPKYICNSGKIDAMLSPKRDTIFIIKGNHCWKFINHKLTFGYPKPTVREWVGIPSKINAAFTHKDITYFVINNEVLFYDEGQMKVSDLTYKFREKIISTVVVQNRLYLFSSTQYWRVNYIEGKWQLKSGYPKLMSNFWKGIPTNIDSVYYDGDKYIYFFKDLNVYKFDINLLNVVDNIMQLNEWIYC